ncbi:MAG: hypothetical protein N3B01_04910 [Verrucomicrobiae bacterium]|nr:hypothetical protein [Verrucomicrobiae bacterium]
MAAPFALLQATAPVVASTPATGRRPRLRAVFVRRDADRYGFGWPGAAFDPKALQALYTRTLSSGAEKLGVELQISHEPLTKLPEMDTFLAECSQNPPDGVIIVAMCKDTAWPMINHFIQKRPAKLPTVVFSAMGTSFLDGIQAAIAAAKGTRTYIASTPDIQWLAFGVRMLHTLWRMKTTRICVVQGKEPCDIVLDAVGTTLHYVPFTRFSDEYKKVAETAEARAIANYYTRHAKKIVEPTRTDVVNAAKTYVVCRRLMETEGCDGIAVDCLPHVRGRTAPPPCLAFSKLLDEGVVAACQADWPAALSLQLVWLLLERPGFMQNICVDTVHNKLVGAHCTSPVRLAGPDQPAVPFLLRSHAESGLGVAPQVLWPAGQPITITKFSDATWWVPPKTPQTAATAILLGTGRVVQNIDNPPAGGCRTSLVVEVDGLDDVRSLRFLHHQLFVLGNHKDRLRAYCELAGLEAKPLWT